MIAGNRVLQQQARVNGNTWHKQQQGQQKAGDEMFILERICAEAVSHRFSRVPPLLIIVQRCKHAVSCSCTKELQCYVVRMQLLICSGNMNGESPSLTVLSMLASNMQGHHAPTGSEWV